MPNIIPIPFDMLTRPTKAVIGAKFIVIAFHGSFYVEASDPPKVRQLNFPEAPFGDAEGAACSYRKIKGMDVYLVAADTRDVDTNTFQTVLYTSNDAITWRLSFKAPVSTSVPFMDSHSSAIVFAGGKFHQSYITHEYHDDADDLSVEYEHSSINGDSWSEPVNYGTIDSDETTGYRSPFPVNYCGHHNCKDMWKQNVPDGFMYVDERVLIRPTSPPPLSYSNGTLFFGDSEFVEKRSNQIQVVIGDVTKSLSVTDLDYVFCASAHGDLLVAGGGGGLAISRDGGKTWQINKLGVTSPVVFNIIAAA